MIDRDPEAEFTACLVTRGDVDLQPILDVLGQLPCFIVIWDNSRKDYDWSVLGRYRAARMAPTGLVYVQDDDCVLPPESIRALLAAWEPGALVSNMPAAFRHDFYEHHALVGFGAVFDRDLPDEALTRFTTMTGAAISPEMLARTSDIVVTGLSRRILLDVPYENLPWATGDDRMYRQPNHVGERKRMLELVRSIR